ncbi:MAG TPA: hypothetical protein VNE16_06950 [Vicinamibacterales bacterium]|nr:hypothetical protein [Vicinamibacterales bacterium]
MSAMQSFTSRVSTYLDQRSLCHSVDAFIAELEQLAQLHPGAVDVNNVRARVEAMVDLLEGRLDWAQVGLKTAQRLASRVYEIRRVEEMLLMRLRGEDAPAALLLATAGASATAYEYPSA